MAKDMDSDHVLLSGYERIIFQNVCLYFKTHEKIGLTAMLPNEK